MGFFSAFNQYLISTQLALHNRSWPKLAVREPSRGVLGLCVIIYRRVNRTAHEVDREGVFEQTSRRGRTPGRLYTMCAAKCRSIA